MWIAAGLVAWLGTGGTAATQRATAAATVTRGIEARFGVRYKGLESHYRVGAVFVLPQQTLTLEVVGGTPRAAVLRSTAGNVRRVRAATWRWQAPTQPGLYPLHLLDASRRDTVTLNAFVLVPAARQRGDYLNHYRVGRYPKRPLRGLAAYESPEGFVEVTRENRDVLVAPHFRLGEFVAKQGGAYPRYVVLDERLLLKLEYLLARVRANGFPAARFHVMSGYRTPFYNRAIGNVGYSRHVYGAAADIFVDDAPRDGVMDDLNGDGRIDVADARVLTALVEGEANTPDYRAFVGGLASYPATRAHGPFVHVDVRGYKARW